MWEIKNKEEIRIQKRRSWKNAIQLSIGFLIFFPILTALQLRYFGLKLQKTDLLIRKMTWEEIFDDKFDFLLMGIIMGVFVLLTYNISLKKSTFKCIQCGNTRSDDKQYKCTCGGTYYNLDQLKWRE